MTTFEEYRQQLATTHGIDAGHMDLLSSSDPDLLEAQAQKVGALLAGRTPAFQPNPGQGHGGTPDPNAMDEAEYRKYYPQRGN